jgi:RND superfamily putative drug exporter
VIARAFALLVAGPFRFLVVALGIAACVGAYLTLPAISENQGQPLAVAPSGSQAESAVQRSIQDFGFPFVSEIAIVQRDPQGLSQDAQRRAVDRAARIDQGQEKSRYPGILSAIPIINAQGAPAAKENGTTIVTLLQLDPNLNLYRQYQLANRYAREQLNNPDDHLVGVTGAVPARAVQGDLIDAAMPLVEFASVAVIFILISLRFRAPGAGLLTLAVSGVGYLLANHIVAWAAQRYGLAIPIELAPLLVVLVLAVTTDYTVFLLAGARAEMENGERPTIASRVATAEFAPMILVAALTVAGSAASMAIANLEFLHVLGPALGLAVVVSALVALAFVPAAISSFGRWIFWPGLRWRDMPVPQASAPASDPGPIRRAIAHLQSIRLAAFGLTGLAILVLLFAAGGLTRLHMGVSLVDDIPRDTAESRAAQAAADGFAPGIVSPTELVVEQPGIGSHRAELLKLEDSVAREPGVAGVVGPREQLPGMPQGVFVSRDGNAARVVVILAADPYSAAAVAAARQLDGDMPRLVREAGLGGATAVMAGDTAAGAETIDALKASVIPVAVLIAGVELVLMAVLLRALVAPLYLLAAGALSAAAPLGLMAYLFTWAGHPDISYYVPVGAAVLMVSLGADYNLFLVGRIWGELDERSVGGAIRAAAPRAARSIATAALALSLSFATLAIVPLVSFRAFAFAMGAGALIDSYLVRGQLVPAMVSLFGRVGAWPGAAYHAATGRRYWVA